MTMTSEEKLELVKKICSTEFFSTNEKLTLINALTGKEEENVKETPHVSRENLCACEDTKLSGKEMVDAAANVLEERKRKFIDILTEK